MFSCTSPCYKTFVKIHQEFIECSDQILRG
uniref:Uncharacterized protein n=1 Tax=Anguilla anguilla TaxID=7936 RepID=A0A0E9XZ59_ANGAN